MALRMTEELLADETRVVLLSAGGPTNDATIRDLVTERLRVPVVNFLAQWERATLVLWRRMTELGVAEQYGGAGELGNAAAVWEFRQLQLEGKLLRLADVMISANIPMMLLKGGGLAYSVYEDFTERPMNDIDVLVPRERAEEAWKLVQDHGWRWDPQSYALESYKYHHHLPPLADRSGSGLMVEIHTDPCPTGHPFGFTAESLWDRPLEIEVKGRPLLVPSREDQLLHCCIHFVWMHFLNEKGWLAFRDVWAFVRSKSVNWDEFLKIATDAHAETCAYWTLRLARALVHVEVPERVLSGLKPPLPNAVLAALERQYALNMFPTDTQCPSAALREAFWRLGVRRGKRLERFFPTAIAREKPLTPLGDRVATHAREWRRWPNYLRALIFAR